MRQDNVTLVTTVTLVQTALIQQMELWEISVPRGDTVVSIGAYDFKHVNIILIKSILIIAFILIKYHTCTYFLR